MWDMKDMTEAAADMMAEDLITGAADMMAAADPAAEDLITEAVDMMAVDLAAATNNGIRNEGE